MCGFECMCALCACVGVHAHAYESANVCMCGLECMCGFEWMCALTHCVHVCSCLFNRLSVYLRPSPSVTASVPLPTAHPLLNQPCQLQLELEPCRRKTLETCSQLFTESGLTRDCVHVSESQFMRVCASVRSAHGRGIVAEFASAWARGMVAESAYESVHACVLVLVWV